MGRVVLDVKNNLRKSWAWRYAQHRCLLFNDVGGFSVKYYASVLAAVVALSTVPAQAALIGDYRLDGSIVNETGLPYALSNNGGVLGSNGITFGVGQGPSITGFSNTGVYSIEVAFSLDQLSGYRRLLDFKNRTSDTGLYSLSRSTNFYNVASSATIDFAPGVLARLVLTRDATGNTVAYVGNTATLSFLDSGNLATINSVLNFFNDDNSVGGEQSSGFVDYIRIYDTALTANEVAGLTPPGAVGGAVPEPATWAMMLLGFGLVGTSLRLRRVSSAAA
jgi:PEP-CTERM motif